MTQYRCPACGHSLNRQIADYRRTVPVKVKEVDAAAIAARKEHRRRYWREWSRNRYRTDPAFRERKKRQVAEYNARKRSERAA